MPSQIAPDDLQKDDLKKIEEGIRAKYQQVAKSPEGQFKYPTGKKGLEPLHYDRRVINNLPDAVASSYCGVGNPFSVAKIEKGEQVLDVGCGAGVDAIIASMMTGPTGRVVGIDIVPEMIGKAETNLKLTDQDNVAFQKISGEDLPFPETTFDVVVSNGVINLIPDKERALTEIFRVLKPGGRLSVADQAAAGAIQKDLKTRLANWFR
jgi:SAM-dependent methyltransferase